MTAKEEDWMCPICGGYLIRFRTNQELWVNIECTELECRFRAGEPIPRMTVWEHLMQEEA